jgi:hypothetical protein
MLLYLFIQKGDKTGCSKYRGIPLLPTTYKILSNILLSGLTLYTDEAFRIITVNFDITDQLLIRYSTFFRYWRKCEYNVTVHKLFIDFEKVYDSVRREVFYNILNEFGMPVNLLG